MIKQKIFDEKRSYDVYILAIAIAINHVMQFQFNSSPCAARAACKESLIIIDINIINIIYQRLYTNNTSIVILYFIGAVNHWLCYQYTIILWFNDVILKIVFILLMLFMLQHYYICCISNLVGQCTWFLLCIIGEYIVTGKQSLHCFLYQKIIPYYVMQINHLHYSTCIIYRCKVHINKYMISKLNQHHKCTNILLHIYIHNPYLLIRNKYSMQSVM